MFKSIDYPMPNKLSIVGQKISERRGGRGRGRGRNHFSFAELELRDTPSTVPTISFLGLLDLPSLRFLTISNYALSKSQFEEILSILHLQIIHFKNVVIGRDPNQRRRGWIDDDWGVEIAEDELGWGIPQPAQQLEPVLDDILPVSSFGKDILQHSQLVQFDFTNCKFYWPLSNYITYLPKLSSLDFLFCVFEFSIRNIFFTNFLPPPPMLTSLTFKDCRNGLIEDRHQHEEDGVIDPFTFTFKKLTSFTNIFDERLLLYKYLPLMPNLYKLSVRLDVTNYKRLVLGYKNLPQLRELRIFSHLNPAIYFPVKDELPNLLCFEISPRIFRKDIICHFPRGVPEFPPCIQRISVPPFSGPGSGYHPLIVTPILSTLHSDYFSSPYPRTKGTPTILRPDFFLRHTAITSIDLSNCFLKYEKFPNIVTGPRGDIPLSSLLKLNLSANRIKRIRKIIAPNLTFLSLKRNVLTSLPDSIGSCLPSLRHFYISHNLICILPDSIGCMKNLLVLDAQCNKISRLPPTLGNLKNLLRLNLSDNRLGKFSLNEKETFKYVNKSTAYVATTSHNSPLTPKNPQFTFFDPCNPNQWKSLTSLKFLNISNNGLNFNSGVDSFISSLSNLASINWSENKFTINPFEYMLSDQNQNPNSDSNSNSIDFIPQDQMTPIFIRKGFPHLRFVGPRQPPPRPCIRNSPRDYYERYTLLFEEKKFHNPSNRSNRRGGRRRRRGGWGRRGGRRRRYRLDPFNANGKYFPFYLQVPDLSIMTVYSNQDAIQLAGRPKIWKKKILVPPVFDTFPNLGFTSTVPALVFSVSLKRIVLTDTFLQHLPRHCFESCTFLEYCLLSRNRIMNPLPSFKNCKNLYSLNLSHNKIKIFPENDVFPPNLHHLNLSFNSIRSFPAATVENPLSTVITINLSFNYLDLLAPFFSKLQNLQKVIISHNRLKKLPDFYTGTLFKTKCFYILASFNKIRKIPKSFFQKESKLKYLYLGNNLIEKLPKDISKTKELRKFDLSNNRIQSIPDSLGGAHTLRYLDVSFNNLIKIPNSVAMKNTLRVNTVGNKHLKHSKRLRSESSRGRGGYARRYVRGGGYNGYY